MKVAVCYVHPDLHHGTYVPLAKRFARTYMENPSGIRDHDLHVLVNLGLPNRAHTYQALFNPLPVNLHFHDNSGKDIGAFQMAARRIGCDLLVCLGAPVYFHKPGWLDQIIDVYERNGPALYGCWAFHNPANHIRTTSFWMPPQLLQSYPYQVNDGYRYEFEHGQNSIVAHARSLGMESYMVTWKGCFGVTQWHHASQEDSLMLDQHCG